MIDPQQPQQNAPQSAVVELDPTTYTPFDSGRPVEQAGQDLRQSIAYGVQQNPDEQAKLLKQQQVTGMSPQAAAPLATETQQAIDVENLNPEQMVVSHPRTAAWAINPDNSAVSGADELHRLTRIEQHAATMRAYTPTWRDSVSDAAQQAYQFLGGSGSLKQRVFDYPLVRIGVGALRGAEETVGNAASFVGIHGDNSEGLNYVQRQARSLEPFNFGEQETGLDRMAATVGPILPALMASGGTSVIARTLGLSERAAKVLAGLSVGAGFTADQGGQTFNTTKARGASDYDARLAANRAAAINAPANALFGATEAVPFLRDNPFLTSIGLGGLTGTSGQLAQNVVTGRPLTEGLASSALQGAAVQGGMHLGTEFAQSMADTVSEVQASKLRQRSQEKFEDAVNQIFRGDESLRIPAQDFVNYFAGKDIDPAKMANQIGASNLDEASAAGADLEIPKANFFARLDPEHQRGLLQDIVDPQSDMTMRQVAAGKNELGDWIAGGGAEKLQADFAAADQETQASPEWQKVYGDLKQRYVDAGESDVAAESYATLQANAIANLATRAGMKPDELLALHNPEITTSEGIGGPTLNQSVFHGSPFNFDKFTLDALGTGEGAQAYGWGLYFAGDKAIAEYYRDRLSRRALLDGKQMDSFRLDGNETMMRQMFENRKVAGLSDEEARKQTADWAKAQPRIKDMLGEKGIKKFLKRLSTGRGQLYEADIPNDDEMLHWDESFGNQPEKVKLGLHNLLANLTELESPRAEDLKDVIENNLPGQHIYSALAGWPDDEEGFENAQDASEALHNVGIQGIKYLDANSRRSGGDLHNYVAFDDNAIKVLKTYYQDEAKTSDGETEGKRGWFRVLPDGRYEIGKTKIGDFSTFIHEPAHAYLELFRELTQREGASEELKGDFAKIAEWLGTTPEEAYKNGFTREQHEQWARANEQYVREGKAPTSGLERAFHNFGVWLSSIYRRASALGVDLSSDIRGVMDRLYAGNSAVDRAEAEAGKQQLFETPEEAGWTEEDFRKYARGRGVEEMEARKLILGEMKAAADRERTQAFREEKSNVRDAATAEIDQRPEYRAIRALRKGELEDGTALTLDRDALVKQFGEERVKALQAQHRGLYRSEGGTDAETAAEMLGFGSGEEMMRALEKAPRRAAAIEQATRETMTARHGDIRYDGSLPDKARLAVENQERAKSVHSELAALRARVAVLEKRAADAKQAMRSIAIEPLEHYQEAARQMIDQKAIVDLQPYRYLNASRKFSREAFDALRKGNVKAAADAKNKELLNHFLFREASAARDYATKFESYVKRMQSKGIQQRLGLADQNVKQAGGVGDYRDQFNWLMARYRLGAAPQAPERPLRAWADEVYGAGNEPAIDASILDGDRSRFVDYRNAPLSEVRNLHDALVNIRHLALQEFKMYVQGKQIAFAEAKQAMIEAARENLKSKPERVFKRNATRAERAVNLAQRGDALLMRTERLVEWLDGGKTGPWHDNLWNLAADSQGDEYALQHQITKAVGDAIANMPESMRKRLWEDKVAVEGIPESLTRHDLVSMAFNMGNEGNLDRLRKTFQFHGYDPEAVERVAGMLTREEWKFVQDTWNLLKPLGERMQELEKRLTGLPPRMVEVRPFKVVRPEGNEEIELDGGYFPIDYDPAFTLKGHIEEQSKTAQNMMEAGYGRAATSRNYTKERSGFGGPLLFDFEQTLTGHTAKVIKDLSHREFMLAANRFLLDADIRRTLRETLGAAYEEQMTPWLRTIVNDRNGSATQGLGDVSKLMRRLRSNLTLATLTYKVSTSLLQWTHAPRMLLLTRPGAYAQAMVDFLAHPIDMTREVRNLSPNEMRFRGEDLDRDVRDKLQELSGAGSNKNLALQVARAGNLSIKYTDHVLSFPLWLSVYRDALARHIDLPEDEAQDKAAHEADSAVRLGLGSSSPKDLPPIMRNNDLTKLVTMFYSFHNGIYGQIRDIGHQFRQDRSYGKLAYGLTLSVLVPAVLSQLITGQKPEDGENPGLWAAKRSLLFAADTIPLLRDAVSYFDRHQGVHFSALETVLEKGGKAAIDANSPKEDKDWLGIGLNALEAAMDISGVPGTTQGMKIARYVKRVSEGKVENPSLWNALVGGGH